MRRRVLSLVLAAMALLAVAGSASAQMIRVDQIQGFQQMMPETPVASGTFMPQVRATDEVTASLGTVVAPYITDLDAWFASSFQWRPSTPTHFLLVADEQQLVNTVESFRGMALTSEERNTVLSRPTHLMQATMPSMGVEAGHWVILVNLDENAALFTAQGLQGRFAVQVGMPVTPFPTETQEGWRLIQWSIARDYANLMVMETAGMGGPQFYREGFVDTVAFRLVPGTPLESGTASLVANYRFNNNELPTLMTLESNWEGFISSASVNFDLARGISFLSVNNVFNEVGPMRSLEVLMRTSRGESYTRVLEDVSGFSLDGLNQSYTSLIP
jgi:hypothetical protein